MAHREEDKAEIDLSDDNDMSNDNADASIGSNAEVSHNLID